MRILHTESSPGWGGQEIRILKEAEGMRERGHEVLFLIQQGGGLVEPARQAGFLVHECNFRKQNSIQIMLRVAYLLLKYRIDVINTHSSLDAWLAGFIGKLIGRPVVRTRHLSTPIRGGINSRLLYNLLADIVVTTCSSIVPVICSQAKIPKTRCRSIPTGVNPQTVKYTDQEMDEFRQKYGIEESDVVAGTLCVMRGWKGISDLLLAAKCLDDLPKLKWLIIGGGVSEHQFREECKQLKLEKKVIFTSHLSIPFAALNALDIFLLLSWAHEGVSQASLQAAWLKKPLITTFIGGLPEICIHEETGFIVSPKSPEEVANAVKKLIDNPQLRIEMGRKAKELVASRFFFSQTIENMERAYLDVLK